MEEYTPEELAENALWESWKVRFKVPSQDVPLDRVQYENPHGTEWRIVRNQEVTCYRERCAVDGGYVPKGSSPVDGYCDRHTFGFVRSQTWESKEGWRADYFAKENDVWDLGAN